LTNAWDCSGSAITASKITRVRTIGVPVTEQDRALDFYLGTLGFAKRIVDASAVAILSMRVVKRCTLPTRRLEKTSNGRAPRDHSWEDIGRRALGVVADASDASDVIESLTRAKANLWTRTFTSPP
jgi:hypothetical protein